jgi:3-hydroxyacyl-[acyl-carrier-protein] dehydratase
MSDFFKIHDKKIEGENWTFRLALNATHPVYKGHFPQQAITPGAMLTEMIREIAEAEIGSKLKMVRARNIKFLNMMIPDKASDVALTMNVVKGDEISVQAEAKIGEDTYFKISSVYIRI